MTISRLCSDSRTQRRRRPSRLATAALLISCVCVAAIAETDTRERDALLCAALTRGARDTVALGYSQEAIEQLDEALSYKPTSPDGNYLRALVGLSAGESPASAIPRLQTALTGGEFLLFSRDEARLLYATLLARTRRPEEALRYVDGMAPSSQSLFVRTIASLAVGDRDAAATAVLSSLRRYPADPRPLIAWLRNAERPFSASPDDSVVAAAFASLDALKDADSAVLVALAPYAVDQRQSGFMVREFRANGGVSADATVLAFRLGLIGEAQAIRELFSGDYVPTIDSIEALVSQLSSESAKAELSRVFSSYSGAIAHDANRDGIPESTVDYAKGEPLTWTVDANQDGVVELAVDFGSGAPVALQASYGTTSLVLGYDAWPYVRTARFTDADGTREYALGPSVLPVVALEMNSFFAGTGSGLYSILRTDEPLPLESTVVSVAYAATRSSAEHTERVELSDGQPTRAWWHEVDGRTGLVEYVRGTPRDEAVDLDGDGRYEARRRWQAGIDGVPQAVRIEVDADGNGSYEYRETLPEPFVRSWDYDDDGRVDMTLRIESSSETRYRFRFEPDESRWIEAVYERGVLVSVLEDGAPVVITADSGGNVLWIGAKPFDFGAATPAPGYGTHGGIRYRVLRIGEYTYAQVLGN